ncbi:hypothetical protein [Variovorax sp. RCC_210]|uniref:hypothetical protein n=1 Tax=Variovorax sp. RCC_210 TaxID=3239217 RepID=UPI003525A922
MRIETGFTFARHDAYFQQAPRRNNNAGAVWFSRASSGEGNGVAWITLGFFLVSVIEHWTFGWFAYVTGGL